MTDTYVIRRRKANGKGWEYLRDVTFGNWVSLTRSYRYICKGDALWAVKGLMDDPGDFEVCRMVPTVRWAVDVVDCKGYVMRIDVGPIMSPHEVRDSYKAAGYPVARIIKRTTYRPEPVK